MTTSMISYWAKVFVTSTHAREDIRTFCGFPFTVTLTYSDMLSAETLLSSWNSFLAY